MATCGPSPDGSINMRLPAAAAHVWHDMHPRARLRESEFIVCVRAELCMIHVCARGSRAGCCSCVHCSSVVHSPPTPWLIGLLALPFQAFRTLRPAPLRPRRQVAAVCVYLFCRIEQKPYMLIDFSDHLSINVYALGRAGGGAAEGAGPCGLRLHRVLKAADCGCESQTLAWLGLFFY